MSDSSNYGWQGKPRKRIRKRVRKRKAVSSAATTTSKSKSGNIVKQKVRDLLSEVRLRSRFWAWRFELFNKEHSGLCRGAKYAVGGVSAALVLAMIVGLFYYIKACRYDLKEVAYVEGGANVIDWSGATIGRIVPKKPEDRQPRTSSPALDRRAFGD
ncbi:MAG: hypothetical protein AAGH89_01185 [Verrucomicrobiota bacterium]